MLWSLLTTVHDSVLDLVYAATAKSGETYMSLPLGWRRFILDVYPFLDIIAFTLLTFYVVQSRIAKPIKSVNWWAVAGCSILFALTGLFLFYCFTMMAMAQAYTHNQGIIAMGLIPEEQTENPFVPHLPPDLVFGFTQQNVTELLTLLNPVEGSMGISWYQNYIWADTLLALPLYIFIHLNILSFLYPNEDDATFFIHKMPFILGALDLFENLGHLIGTYTLTGLAPDFMSKVMNANQAKFITFVVMMGLEVSGLMQKIGSAVSKEIKVSGLTATAPEAEKKAEEKKKARLEKKGRKAE
ncbi:hypothetical protein BJ741DRAFT_614327 [Chytriomyces cf. hyalinus JEL632]|nr:hypothetical protein BJ741DRAFT_614327 [Chytriomyces cf. hyalinus JEL632]